MLRGTSEPRGGGFLFHHPLLLHLVLLHLRPEGPSLSPPASDSTPRHLVVSSCSLHPLVHPFARRPHSCSPCQTHEPIDCRFCIICQDPNSLMHVPSLPPPPFLLSLPSAKPPSDLFLYSPVTYSAVGVFFNNERNVSFTTNLFHDKRRTWRDQMSELMPRKIIFAPAE